MHISLLPTTKGFSFTGSLLPPERAHQAPSSNKQFKSRATAGFYTSIEDIHWQSQLKFLRSKDPVREKVKIARHMENKALEM